MLEQIIHSFVASLNQPHYFRALFKQESFILQLHSTEKEAYTICIADGKCTLLSQSESPSLSITGNEQMIAQLLTGSQSLKYLLQSFKIKMNGSYRKQLLFEAILHLNHHQMKQGE